MKILIILLAFYTFVVNQYKPARDEDEVKISLSEWLKKRRRLAQPTTRTLLATHTETNTEKWIRLTEESHQWARSLKTQQRT